MKNIALHGFAGTGKDEVGKILIRKYGFQRMAFGDYIKHDLDSLVKAHLGFSAFTEVPAEKERIRQVLVHWGYANYKSIFTRFFADLALATKPVVNTRIFRVQECKAWIKRGGVVWLVSRPGYGPAEPKEKEELNKCIESGCIHKYIKNDGSLSDLEDKVSYEVEKLKLTIEQTMELLEWKRKKKWTR